MNKRVLITTGGTGGHIFPAMALAKQLSQIDPSIQLLFVGGKLSANRYFARETFPFREIPCGTLPLKKPLTAIRNAGHIVQGIISSRNIIQSFKPDIVVGFGSFYTLPTLLAAKWQSVPIILHEANRIPGKVNRLLSKYATITGVHFPDTAKHLKGKTIEVAVPLRDNFKLGTTTPSQAKAHFKLDPNRPVLLIFGGSQGAQSMNQIVLEAILTLNHPHLQILHFSGDVESAQLFQRQYDASGIKATVKAFENRMDLAWQAADMVISRAGAGTIAEAMEFEVPGILIPFPHATDNHQESNADFMVDVVNGAVKYIESEMLPIELARTIEEFLANDLRDLRVKREAIHRYKKREKPQDLSTIVRQFLTHI